MSENIVFNDLPIDILFICYPVLKDAITTTVCCCGAKPVGWKSFVNDKFVGLQSCVCECGRSGVCVSTPRGAEIDRWRKLISRASESLS